MLLNQLIILAMSLIFFVESSDGTNTKPGDNGKAIGPYQLHKIYVDDVNRIYKRNYSYDDRKNLQKSRTMVFLYLRHYSLRYMAKTGKKCTISIICKLHNGGPNGYKLKNKRYMKLIKGAACRKRIALD